MPAPITPTGSPATLTLAPVTRWIRAINAARSRDDVGDEAGAQALDLVLQDELALLQALQLQAILHRVAGQAADHVVEIVVLDFQRRKALTNLGFFLFGQGRVGHAVKNVMPVGESYSLYSPRRK